MISTGKITRKLRRFSAKTADLLLDKRLFLSTRNYQKFIILCTGRTGSNFLCSLLQSHSKIRAFAEILYKDPKRKQIYWDYPGFNSEEIWNLREHNPKTFIDEIVFRDFPVTVSAVGFKLFYNHAQEDNDKHIWEHLNNIKDLKIIHLKRENILDQYISLRKAKETKRWINKKDNNNSSDDFKMTISPDDCIKHFQTIRNLEEKFDDFFKHHSILNVTYEDLIANPVREGKKIQAFLNIDYQKLYASTYKQSHQSKEQIINNYNELEASFKNTLWSVFFDKE